jgi:hypothetical protein
MRVNTLQELDFQKDFYQKRYNELEYWYEKWEILRWDFDEYVEEIKNQYKKMVDDSLLEPNDCE